MEVGDTRKGIDVVLYLQSVQKLIPKILHFPLICAGFEENPFRESKEVCQ